MVAENNLILEKKRLKQIVRRIAFQILEENYNEKVILIAGLEENGYTFAKFLEKELAEITQIPTRLVKISLDKQAKRQPDVSLDIPLHELKGKSVVVADDVLNTGRALMYSLRPFLENNVTKLKTAVIVNRDHKTFPVATDYVGYSLATTLKEHIEVNFSEKNYGVYLH